MVERHILVLTLDNEEANSSIPELLSALSTSPDDLFHFEHVTSVDDAVALLQKTSFTVVLLGLPIGQTIASGLNLLVQMRYIRPEVPIITFVTQQTLGLGLQALEFGAYSYVSTQSVTSPILRKLIDKAAAKKRLLQEAYDQGNMDQTLFASLPVCVAILSETGHVTAVNQEWESLAQSTNDPLIAETVTGIDFPQLCERIQKPDLALIVRKILDGKQMKYSHEYPWKQGNQIIWWMISIIALGHPRGGVVLSIREVTETVANQIRLSSYETEFSDLKSGVVTLVHDLRNPLATMHLYLDLLKYGSPTKREHYLTILNQTTIHMGQFIDDLLTLSRLEQTEETKLFRPTNIGDLVEHVVGLQQPLATSRGLFLGCEVKQDILLVNGDPRQLTRVITNLVSNAIRYTEIGGIQVTVERDDASKQILLTVADSGVGIAPEAFPHIFEPFFRSERAQIMTDAGSGLGLSIVQRIVASHSGYIEVSSDSAQGSTFNVFLPALAIGDPPF